MVTARPPGSLADIVDIAQRGANRVRSIGFGPIPLRLAAESDEQIDRIADRLVDGAHPTWRTLDVALISAATLAPGDLPAELRPASDDQVHVVRDGALFALAAGGERALWVLDPERSLGVRWTNAYDDVPLWEQSSPLRVAARWWSTEHGASMVHTGAVANADGAILLVGDGGAGKSTTTMACLGTGLDVLGDDYCFVQPPAYDGDDALVHAVYRHAKLDDRSLTLLPQLRDRVVGTGVRSKSLIQLDTLSNPTRPVRAICHVTQRPGKPTEVEPISRIEALRAVAPSTMFQMRLLERETWAGIAAAVRVLPSFRLYVGDVGDIAGVVANTLNQLDARMM